MHRFFLPGGLPNGNSVELTGAAAGQVARVLRMRPGDEIGVFDGSGVQWTVKLDRVSARSVTGRVADVTRPATEPRVRLTLYQSIIDAAQFELVLQKGVELGVARLVPLVTERVRGAGPTRASANRRDRWEKIVREAAEQSGRVLVPDIAGVATLDEAFGSHREDCLIVPWEAEVACSLYSALRTDSARAARSIGIVIGPKGGLTGAEVESLRTRGAVTVTLGTRILRSETAAIATLSAILYERGELGERGDRAGQS